MNYKKYAINMLDSIYSDGDVDVVFFSQLLGAVSYDAEDNPFQKTKKQRLSDAVSLANYLVSIGDFSVGEMVTPEIGLSYFNAYPKGTTTLHEVVNDIFKNEDDIDDVDLTIKIVFRKNIANTLSPCNIPDSILYLFK